MDLGPLGWVQLDQAMRREQDVALKGDMKDVNNS